MLSWIYVIFGQFYEVEAHVMWSSFELGKRVLLDVLKRESSLYGLPNRFDRNCLHTCLVCIVIMDCVETRMFNIRSQINTH